jgi:hypothetical protein
MSHRPVRWLQNCALEVRWVNSEAGTTHVAFNAAHRTNLPIERPVPTRFCAENL